MNKKIEILLHEGFSITTLETFTSEQINVLYERVKKSKKIETKEQSTQQATVKNVTSQVATVDNNQSYIAPPGSKVEVKNGKTIVTTTPTTESELGEEKEIKEKSVSKKQQKAMGIALAAKKGDIPKSELKGSSKEMVKMSKKDLEDFASTKHKGLPEKKKKESKENVKKLEESIMKLIENHLNPTTTKGDLLKTIKSFKR